MCLSIQIKQHIYTIYIYTRKINWNWPPHHKQLPGNPTYLLLAMQTTNVRQTFHDQEKPNSDFQTWKCTKSGPQMKWFNVPIFMYKYHKVSNMCKLPSSFCHAQSLWIHKWLWETLLYITTEHSCVNEPQERYEWKQNNNELENQDDQGYQSNMSSPSQSKGGH